jgi:transposase
MSRGRPPGPTQAVAVRLAEWRRGCERGWSTREIAEEVGVSIKTLRRSVQRARASGHEDAVVHPEAERYTPGNGTTQAVSPAARARRARHRQGGM